MAEEGCIGAMDPRNNWQGWGEGWDGVEITVEGCEENIGALEEALRPPEIGVSEKPLALVVTWTTKESIVEKFKRQRKNLPASCVSKSRRRLLRDFDMVVNRRQTRFSTK